MLKKPAITIRYGSTHDDVEVDGSAFTRHKLDRSSQSRLRRIVIGALEKVGYFLKREAR